MFFYDFFYSEINPEYYFYWKRNIFTFAQICGGFLILGNEQVCYLFKASFIIHTYR